MQLSLFMDTNKLCLYTSTTSDNGKQLPWYQFGVTSWLDGMTSSGRSWLSGKLKTLDPHRLLWKSGKSSVFPCIIGASGDYNRGGLVCQVESRVSQPFHLHRRWKQTKDICISKRRSTNSLFTLERVDIWRRFLLAQRPGSQWGILQVQQVLLILRCRIR